MDVQTHACTNEIIIIEPFKVYQDGDQHSLFPLQTQCYKPRVSSVL